MAIKYVKDFRSPLRSSETDEQVIQNAIYDLEDGDTLIFERNVKYMIGNPVNFTLYKDKDNDNRIISKCRMGITFIGNGCVISNTKVSFPPYNTMFLLSHSTTDDELSPEIKPGEYRYYTASGLVDCTIRGFNFIGTAYDHQDDHMRAMGPMESIPGSTYIKNCTIENCMFNEFNTGLYIGGKYNTVKNCYFSLCNTAIKADCPDYGNIHSNYFYQSENTGLLLTKPYGTNVHGNTFIRCKGDSIRVDGTLDSSTDEKMLGVSIYSNYISGDLADNKIEDQNRIFVSGAKSAIIRDNIIRNMKCVNATDSTGKNQGNGICIDGVNNTHNSVVRFCNKTTVSGNQIFDCMNAGIRTDYSQDCVFSDNTVYSHAGDKAATGDCGIRIAKNTSRNVFSNNTLYDYDDNNDIVNNAIGYTVVRGNISVPSAYSDNIASPIRFIRDSSIHSADTSIIVIPDQSEPLVDKEEFFLYVPKAHKVTNAMEWSYISYNGESGIVRDTNGETKIPESYYGKYIKLRYDILTSRYSTSYRYTIVE